MDQTIAMLGILAWIAVKIPVIQQIMTTLAALPPIHATLERETVTLMTSVLEIWFVEQTTALRVVLTSIVVPPLQAPHLLLAWTSSGWGTTPWWTAATGPLGFQCQVSVSGCGNSDGEWKVND